MATRWSRPILPPQHRPARRRHRKAARLYFKYRPARIPLAADPDLITHRAFGIPRRNVTDQLMRDYETLPVNPTGEAPEPMPVKKLVPSDDELLAVAVSIA